MRVLRHALDPYFEVQMRAGRTAGGTDISNMLATSHDVADLHQQARSMRITGNHVIAMVDFHHIPVLRMEFSHCHHTASSRHDRRTDRRSKVYPLMHRAATRERIEATAEGRSVVADVNRLDGRQQLGFDLVAHQRRLDHIHIVGTTLDVVRHRNLVPLIDFAYQGFGDGLEQDAWSTRLFAAELPEVLITSSCSKNFGLYRDRTGALIVCAKTADKLVDIRSQLANIARNLWSTPPDHGAAVVATILGEPELKSLWADEVEAMRLRIAQLRSGLVEALEPHGLRERFAHIGVQRGMFSYTGLTPDQVKQLRDHHSVYMVGTGRANVAGIDATRLDLLAEAIAEVCK